MSLLAPTFFEKTFAFIWAHKRLVGIAVSCVVALLLVWYLITYAESCNSRRQIDKDKQAIANKLDQRTNINAQIANLEVERAKVDGEIQVDTQTLANNVNAREDIKAETNKAIANYQQAVKSNTNVDVTAEDLKRVIGKLDQ